MEIKPLADRVVLKKEKAEEKSKGGIILTASAQEKPVFSIVVAVGPGTKDSPITVKVGDKVLTDKYGGTEVKISDETYTIVREGDILAVVE